MNIKNIILTAGISIVTAATTSYFISNLATTEKSVVVNSTNINLQQELTDFIQKNPEMIIDSLQKGQMAKAAQEEDKASETAVKLRSQLENSATDGQAGNKSSKVAMVAFIDHNCGYCRKSEPEIERLLSDNLDFKFIVKDFPILGDFSVEKAKASIAIARISPEKWYDFYKEINRTSTQTIEQVIELAQTKLDIEPELLKIEMASEATKAKIDENRALGEQLAIRGTPAFIINGKVFRGALGYEAFKTAINEASVK